MKCKDNIYLSTALNNDSLKNINSDLSDTSDSSCEEEKR